MLNYQYFTKQSDNAKTDEILDIYVEREESTRSTGPVGLVDPQRELEEAAVDSSTQEPNRMVRKPNHSIVSIHRHLYKRYI
jgi:hypothetical protein